MVTVMPQISNCAAAGVLLGAGLALQPVLAADNIDYLTGDPKLACEAILCLSSIYRPGESTPSLTRYFSIRDKRPSRTIRKRKNFLQLCPKDDSANAVTWNTLIDSIAQSAETCTADGLNSYLASYRYDDNGRQSWVYRSDQIPGFCNRYWDHEWTYFEKQHLPVYIGDVNLKGFWAEPSEKEKAQDRYDRWLVQYREYQRRLSRYYDCVNSSSDSGGSNCRKPVLTWKDPIRE